MHANSVADVPARFAALGSLAGIDAGAVALHVGGAFALVIALRRSRDRIRRVAEVAVFAPPHGAQPLRLLPGVAG